ncbi:MAG: HNH endonuclease signature motif containing protein [Candidatus Pacebacteria bacterium]|nr:HNH endonuclease signature motif containing protein [Candidatus Paceibacterota bacterium]
MKAKTYQGNPCKRAGHTERYVATGACVACHKIYDKKRAKNKERLACAKRWRAANPEKYKALLKKWNVENRKLKAYHCAKRRVMILRQTPPWADMKKIKEIFLSCPDGWHVDHIHPISKGGLHVHWNLQHLTKYDNLVKHNKL